jgi:Family of unknown function (DUF6328)
MTSIDSLLKISLDELRMQMLGAQIAFGFEFQALFHERLQISNAAIRLAVALGFASIVATIGLLIAAPAVHRIADAGNATERTLRLSNGLARKALFTLSVSLSAIVFVATSTEFGVASGWVAAALTAAASLGAWQAWGMLLRRRTERHSENTAVSDAQTSLHHRIDYLLTEARVMLPGAQALLGFQLLAILTQPFESLPNSVRLVHMAALALVALTVILLITPAALHRIVFEGRDDERFASLGSRVITAALIPLAAGISAELYVAATRLLPGSMAPGWAAVSSFGVLIGLWYVLPLALRVSRR